MTTHQPPGTFHPPTGDAVAADSRRRLKALEQRPQPRPNEPRFGITAGNPTPVVAAEARQTGRLWPWRTAWHLEYVTIDARDVAQPTTVEIRRAGLTIPDGNITSTENGTIRLGFDQTWTLGQYLDLTVTGEVGLIVVQMWFRGEGFGHLDFVIPAGGGG